MSSVALAASLNDPGDLSVTTFQGPFAVSVSVSVNTAFVSLEIVGRNGDSDMIDRLKAEQA